ncbi:MAG: hypothetical protein ACFFD1_10440 [Candidatus Thorarchaeota archaeon]
MAQTPNLEVLRELMNKLDEEFDLESRLNRYISNSPELINEGKSSGLNTDIDAARALFISDFILTTSDAPESTSDEDRRKMITGSLLHGIRERNQSTELLVKIFYLALKTSSMIKRSDLFLADRGLNREASLILLKDFYIEPFIRLCSEVLGEGSCTWELSIIAAFLKRTNIQNEQEIFKNAPSYSESTDLSYYCWQLLESYSQIQLLTPNTQITIPNVENSSLILVGNSKPKHHFSFWNLDTPHSSFKDNSNALEFINKYLGKLDGTQPLVYLRARLPKLQQQLIIVRDPFSNHVPLIVMRTAADEINLSEALSLLNIRSKEVQSWLDITKTPKVETKVTIPPPIPESKEEKPVSPPPLMTEVESQSLQKEEPKKIGFFARLFGGGKKKKQEPVMKDSTTSGPEGPKISKPKEKKKEKIKIESLKPKSAKSDLPYFLSHAMITALVGDLQLFEIFDTYRESKYAIQGSFEFDQQEKKGKMFARNKLENAEGINNVVTGIVPVLVTTMKHFFDEEIQVFPEEILFVSKGDLRTIVCMESNEQRLVGTIGSTFVKDVADWRAKEEEIVQRRTLHMRTGQLLQARRHTPLDESIKRIYAGIFDEDIQEFSVDLKNSL